MIIGGFQKNSLIDYPGKISSVIFTLGCNFRCPYCHNPELVNPALFTAPVDKASVFSFLEKRRGLIDAVVITGGEPTLHSDLSEFIVRIKSLGFLVKLDTNGYHPDMLERIICEGNLDYIAMDVKAPIGKYSEVTRCNCDEDNIDRSIQLIINSGVKYEFRTTVAKPLLTLEDIRKIEKRIENAELFYVQDFVHSKTLDPLAFELVSFCKEEMGFLRKNHDKYVKECLVR